jgi:hypothetical protein
LPKPSGTRDNLISPARCTNEPYFGMRRKSGGTWGGPLLVWVRQSFTPNTQCTVRVFRQKFTLEDAIGSHACSLQASRRVTNGIPLESPLFLPVHTVNRVQTLKVNEGIFGRRYVRQVRCGCAVLVWNQMCVASLKSAIRAHACWLETWDACDRMARLAGVVHPLTVSLAYGWCRYHRSRQSGTFVLTTAPSLGSILNR